MKDKVKQMVEALLATVGSGDTVDSVTLSSTYQRGNDNTILLEVGVSVLFEAEQKEAPESPSKHKDGGYH